MAIALWLCPKPSNKIHETLTYLSTGLVPICSGSTTVEPHVTITSQLAVNSPSDVSTVLACATAALGNSIDLEIKLTALHVNEKNTYFKKVYLQVEKNKNLVSFTTIMRELYVELPNRKNEAEAKYAAQDWAQQEFDPHVSLIYTDMTHFDMALQKTITTRVQDYLGTDSIYINEPDDLAEYAQGWHGGVLKIVNCEGPPREWEVLGTADIH